MSPHMLRHTGLPYSQREVRDSCGETLGTQYCETWAKNSTLILGGALPLCACFISKLPLISSSSHGHEPERSPRGSCRLGLAPALCPQ